MLTAVPENTLTGHQRALRGEEGKGKGGGKRGNGREGKERRGEKEGNWNFTHCNHLPARSDGQCKFSTLCRPYVVDKLIAILRSRERAK